MSKRGEADVNMLSFITYKVSLHWNIQVYVQSI